MIFRYPTFDLSNIYAPLFALKFEADTVFYMNLNSKCQNVINMGNTQKMQIGEICLTELCCKV